MDTTKKIGDNPPPVPPPPPPAVYDIDKRTADQLAMAFTYHPPDAGAIPGAITPQVDRYTYLRDAAGRLAKDVARLCPSSRERSLAFTKLEEAVMWANAAISRNE